MSTASEYENLVAAFLDDMGVSYKREVSFHPPLDTAVRGLFRVDFCVYDWTVVLEVDDNSHHWRGKGYQDRIKDNYLRSIGWTVVRIKTCDIDRNASFIPTTLAALEESRT